MPSAALRARASELTSASTSPLIIRRLASQPHHLTGELLTCRPDHATGQAWLRPSQAAPAAELVDALFARSEGNPFFTEELLAAVRAGSRELPATLRDLLRGRVQVLPQPTQ
jgi:hypothetical protein